MQKFGTPFFEYLRAYSNHHIRAEKGMHSIFESKPFHTSHSNNPFRHLLPFPPSPPEGRPAGSVTVMRRADPLASGVTTDVCVFPAGRPGPPDSSRQERRDPVVLTPLGSWPSQGMGDFPPAELASKPVGLPLCPGQVGPSLCRVFFLACPGSWPHL